MPHADLNEATRVRQRYADLIVRNEAREMVYKRAGIVRAVRNTLENHGYVEVETPMLLTGSRWCIGPSIQDSPERF